MATSRWSIINQDEVARIAKELFRWIQSDKNSKSALEKIFNVIKLNSQPAPPAPSWFPSWFTKKVEVKHPIDNLASKIRQSQEFDFYSRITAIHEFCQQDEHRMLRLKWLKAVIKYLPNYTDDNDYFSNGLLKSIETYFVAELKKYLGNISRPVAKEIPPPPPPPKPGRVISKGPRKILAKPSVQREELSCEFISAPAFISETLKSSTLDNLTLPGTSDEAYFLTRSELFFVRKTNYRNKFYKIDLDMLKRDQLEELLSLEKKHEQEDESESPLVKALLIKLSAKQLVQLEKIIEFTPDKLTASSKSLSRTQSQKKGTGNQDPIGEQLEEEFKKELDKKLTKLKSTPKKPLVIPQRTTVVGTMFNQQMLTRRQAIQPTEQFDLEVEKLSW